LLYFSPGNAERFARRLIFQRDQAVRMRKRQRTQQRRIHETEHHEAHGDTEREQQHDSRTGLAQATQVSQSGAQRVHFGSS
jgi:hypothetical protein